MSQEARDIRRLNNLFSQYGGTVYEETDNIGIPRGAEDFESKIRAGKKTNSAINKLHIVKLANNYPYNDNELFSSDFFQAKTVSDLCKIEGYGAIYYDIEDFLYCKYVGVPINRLITLRRFATPITDNIYKLKGQTNLVEGPDIARMVTYMTAETNKIEEVLAFSYAMKWKQLTAEFEQASSFGEQSGLSGFMKKVGAIFDSTTSSNYMSGRATGGPMASYDPKFDQNRTYGPVDSINETHIRDIGLDFQKEFEITFDYEIRSINGRTPEYAMKDILGNVLACTFNNGKFWGGARYWVGERPSPWASKLQWMNSGDLDTVLKGMMNTIKTTLESFFGGSNESKIDKLKKALKGGFALAISKLLDGLGRPGIPAMNSLLSSEPVGMWHLMIGNPLNPIMSIGNLILTGCDIKFPTDSLSYGDFPTRMQVVVKLKPAMPKDRGGIEMMMNSGIQKIYWNPSTVEKSKLKNINRKGRYFATSDNDGNSFTDIDIQNAVTEAFDFLPLNNGDHETSTDVQKMGFSGANDSVNPNVTENNTSNDANGDNASAMENNADSLFLMSD